MHLEYADTMHSHQLSRKLMEHTGTLHHRTQKHPGGLRHRTQEHPGALHHGAQKHPGAPHQRTQKHPCALHHGTQKHVPGVPGSHKCWMTHVLSGRCKARACTMPHNLQYYVEHLPCNQATHLTWEEQQQWHFQHIQALHLISAGEASMALELCHH